MKPVHSVLTIVFAIVALCLTVWFGRSSSDVTLAQPKAEPKPDTSALPIPSSGPFGKAVANETTFDFGTVEKDATGSHIFIIKNEGPGPLRVKQGKTSCVQCTIGKVAREGEDILPGESVEVEIQWHIMSEGPKFRQTADIHTTDPDNPKLVFAIVGSIDVPVRLIPDRLWPVGDLSETEPTVAEGMLYSTLVDGIAIERFECTNPRVTVTSEPASPSKMAEKNAKSAVKVKVSIAPDTAVGPFRETVKLYTNVRDGVAVEFNLTGLRPGPISIKGTAGVGWVADTNVLVMGEFPASEGKKAKLLLYVRNFDGELEIQQLEPEKSRSKVHASNTGKVFGKSKIYDIEVEVPPGVPEMRHLRDAEPIVLKLNHPSAGEIKMFVDYLAR